MRAVRGGGWSYHRSSDGRRGNCVEVADLATSIGLRDSKAPEAGHPSLPRTAWAAFVAEVRDGHHVLS
ncbi:DUF397 domain-containing protein [Actinomadura sp. LOL_016]|uniref:DUF397 domain-containing protein n=1 Tax=unclassified Actinomadura TaxID=2626254 RepID=UPI003A801667